MDAKPIKKDIKQSMKEIWNKNHPNLLELVNKNYTSLNHVLDTYKSLFAKLDRLKDPKVWGEPIFDLKKYDELDSLYKKIYAGLEKGFGVAPFKLYSFRINHIDDELIITYYGHHMHTLTIKDFTSITSGGFHTSDFNDKKEPLNIGRVIEHIMYDIDPYWVKNIITYMNECKVIDQTNEIREKLNKKAIIENTKRREKYEKYFEIIDKLKVIFPIKFSNGEKIIFNPEDINNYYLVNNEDKILFSVKGGNLFDNSITSLLFDKSKIDESSIPSLLFDNKLFNNIDDFEKDFEVIKNKYMELVNSNNKYYLNFIRYNNSIKTAKEELEHISTSFVENASYEGGTVNNETKEEVKETITNNRVNIETIKNKIFETLVKYNGRVAKKIEIPNAILFSVNEDGIKVIDERFIGFIKCFDLSKNTFDDVLISGVDFSDCNPRLLNPQTVYGKDLSGSKFNICPFNKYTSFDGVNLSDTIMVFDDNVSLNFSGSIANSDTYININNMELNIANGYSK